MRSLSKAFGWLVLAIVFGLGITMIAYPAAVTQVAGLAIAQSSTQWNQLKDFAQGDAFSSGAASVSPCLFNGLTCDRQRGSIAGGAEVAVKSVSGGVTPADGFATPTNALTTFNFLGLFNATTTDRWRSASATNNTATTSLGGAHVTTLSTWSVTSTPAVATQATASKGAGGGTVRHVAQSITVCVAAGATAQAPVLVHLRDGATGAGTIIRSWAFAQPINTGSCSTQEGLNQTGSANTAMTLETVAAGITATVQATVTLGGYSTP
jgi:hypothetical protein